MVDDGWLTLVRIARDCGDVSSLLPAGVTSMADAPYVWVEAVRMALYYLSFEQYVEEEQPPRKIWLKADKMKRWWAEVKANRKAKMKGQGNLQDMPQNELLKEAFGGRTFRE